MRSLRILTRLYFKVSLGGTTPNVIYSLLTILSVILSIITSIISLNDLGLSFFFLHTYDLEFLR